MMRKVLVVDDDGDGNLMSELHGSAASRNTHWAHLRNTEVYNYIRALPENSNH